MHAHCHTQAFGSTVPGCWHHSSSAGALQRSLRFAPTIQSSRSVRSSLAASSNRCISCSTQTKSNPLFCRRPFRQPQQLADRKRCCSRVVLCQASSKNVFVDIRDTVAYEVGKLAGLWGKFLLMCTLFFLMSFINTLCDSLKDSLVITAVGGGTAVIPFLTVYGVLPCSLLFLVAFTYATQHYTRAQCFNVIICFFLFFFGCFGFLYPQHEALHLHGLAAQLQGFIPSGLSGAVGMVKNWMFTLFYCFSELWGDIVLSLLFWGLANETTSLQDAPLLYPLFGVGANMGQTLAGKSLRVFTNRSAGRLAFATQLQMIMGTVLAVGCMILALHAYITQRFPKNTGEIPAECLQRASQQTSHAATSNGAGPPVESIEVAAGVPLPAGSVAPAAPRTEAGALLDQTPRVKPKPKLTTGEAIKFLAASPQIRALALMALAQGISTSLIEVAWKNHLHILHPSPAAYAAFMGDVAMWTGICTGSLMVFSPLMFEKFGWRGVAGATPRFMIMTGVPFFIGCCIWNFSPAHMGFAGAYALKVLVLGGALLQIFGKGAKFSMFKPAEEMVYIALDEESRTKGKAAIDVVGAQTGKSAGSILQQLCLLASGGIMAGTLPVMGIAYFFMLRTWMGAVDNLATFQHTVVSCSMDAISVDEQPGSPLPSKSVVPA